jgi:hypothetical protein
MATAMQRCPGDCNWIAPSTVLQGEQRAQSKVKGGMQERGKQERSTGRWGKRYGKQNNARKLQIAESNQKKIKHGKKGAYKYFIFIFI